MLILGSTCRISVILEIEKHGEVGNKSHHDERTDNGKWGQVRSGWLTASGDETPSLVLRASRGLAGVSLSQILKAVLFQWLHSLEKQRLESGREHWSSCLLGFSKCCFLKHVVSCHCFGSFVAEIEKRWWILFLAVTLIILQCLCEFWMTDVFTQQTGRQRPRQI